MTAIKAAGLELRLATLTDLATLRSFFDDPGFNEHWGGQPLPDDEIVAKYTGGRSPDVECFIVHRDDEAIGLVQYCVDGNEGTEGGGIDLALIPQARGRGTGTAVVHALVEFLHTKRGWQRITVDPDVSNPRGVNFWTNVGFMPELLIDTEADRAPYWMMSWPLQ